MTGYDVDFVRRVVESVSIPVIASGGAGNYDHMHEVIRRAGASVALVDLMEVVTRLCKAPFRWAARVGNIITGMTKATEAVLAVLANALRLGADEPAELAVELLASLDGPADPDAEAAWAVEIKRRIQGIEDGSIELEPWENVKRRIENEILGG